jgi:hypothetical protein
MWSVRESTSRPRLVARVMLSFGQLIKIDTA